MKYTVCALPETSVIRGKNRFNKVWEDGTHSPAKSGSECDNIRMSAF